MTNLYKKRILALVILLRAFSGIGQTTLEAEDNSLNFEGDPAKKEGFFRQRYADPRTGEIPENINHKALTFANKKKSTSQRLKSNGIDVNNVNWKHRGPFDLGGRMRTMVIDIRNPQVMVAGSVTGGLWRSEDGGASWKKTSTIAENPSVTSIVQDTRPGFEDVWYYTGGELVGSTASVTHTADFVDGFYGGHGVYKSEDGGRTWAVLPATIEGISTRVDNVFDRTWRIVIHPETGDLYVAASGAILKSSDAGDSWTVLLGAESIFSTTDTDVYITKDGTCYAAIGNRYDALPDSLTGIYRSADNGITWTEISAPTVFDKNDIQRMVIGSRNGTNPSVYFLASGKSQHYLLRYNYMAGIGDESGRINHGGTWTDLSENLPKNASPIGTFNPQIGYNLCIAIHPNDSNTVFVGAANLWRSTSGFTDNSSTTKIGGFNTANRFEIYENHHPDIHALYFDPNDANRMFSLSDGGIHVTSNNLGNEMDETPVNWESVNYNLISSQSFGVSLHPESGRPEIVAGFMDNSFRVSMDTTFQHNWVEASVNEGGYGEIANIPGRTVIYTSIIFSNIIRTELDSNNDISSSVTVLNRGQLGDPNSQFVNPMRLDPNDNDMVYTIYGNEFWYLPNASSLPVGNTEIPWLAQPGFEWEKVLGDSDVPAFSNFDVCVTPANKVVLGTRDGNIFVCEDCNSAGAGFTKVATASDLFTPAVGAESAWISCVKVDPSNGDRWFITFSNFGVPSVFMTEDAGTTWTNISGNLEENEDGSGAGPIVFWFENLKIGNSEVFFAGTSTGLYATNELNGTNTVWVQQATNKIGNVAVRMVRARSDGTVAVATHGNGVFSAEFIPDLVSGNEGYEDFEEYMYPNPTNGHLFITNSDQMDLGYSIFNSNGVKLRTQKLGTEAVISIDLSDLDFGLYYIELISPHSRKIGKIYKR